MSDKSNEYATPYLPPCFRRNVQYILDNAERPGLYMEVLTFVYTHRVFEDTDRYGRQVPQNWTQVSHKGMAKALHKRNVDIAEAVDTLVEWGILKEIPKEYESQSRVVGYLKNKVGAKKKKNTAENQDTKQGKPKGKAYVFNHETFYMGAVSVDKEKLSEFPTCPLCGRVIHPEKGWDDKHDICSECCVAKIIENGGPYSGDIVHKGHSKGFFKSQMREWFDESEYRKKSKSKPKEEVSQSKETEQNQEESKSTSHKNSGRERENKKSAAELLGITN